MVDAGWSVNSGSQLQQRSEELDVAAKIADDHGDLVFAKLLRDTAKDLRKQFEDEQRDKK